MPIYSPNVTPAVTAAILRRRQISGFILSAISFFMIPSITYMVMYCKHIIALSSIPIFRQKKYPALWPGYLLSRGKHRACPALWQYARLESQRASYRVEIPAACLRGVAGGFWQRARCFPTSSNCDILRQVRLVLSPPPSGVFVIPRPVILSPG